MAHQANKNCCKCDLVIGEHAWLSTEHLPLVSGLIRKLESYFIGPFKVIGLINSISFKLELPFFLAYASCFTLLSAKEGLGLGQWHCF